MDDPVIPPTYPFTTPTTETPEFSELGAGHQGSGPKTSLYRFLMLAPAAVLILVGVAAVAFSVGANSGGTTPAAPHNAAAQATRAPLASGAPGNPRFGFGASAPVVGTVASKTASTIVVTTTAGKTATVDVSSTTGYQVRGVASATLGDVAVGSRIAAQGTFNADGSLNATEVVVGPGGYGPGFGGSGRGGRGFGRPSPVPSGQSL